MTKNLERKKNTQIYGRTNRRRPIFNSTIQLVNLYTIFEVSILYSCGDIFDEKCREKAKWINKGKNKLEKAGPQTHDTLHNYQPAY